jgi:hypothetical protein
VVGQSRADGGAIPSVLAGAATKWVSVTEALHSRPWASGSKHCSDIHEEKSLAPTWSLPPPAPPRPPCFVWLQMMRSLFLFPEISVASYSCLSLKRRCFQILRICITGILALISRRKAVWRRESSNGMAAHSSVSD